MYRSSLQESCKPHSPVFHISVTTDPLMSTPSQVGLQKILNEKEALPAVMYILVCDHVSAEDTLGKQIRAQVIYILNDLCHVPFIDNK